MQVYKIPVERLGEIDPSVFLAFSDVLDGENPDVRKWVKRVTEGTENQMEKAVKLFYAVRDGIRYTMYAPFMYRKDYAASSILKRGEGYCVQKAILLATAYRVEGIPSVLIFADIKNHRAPEKAREFMGTDVFTYHGYVALHLNGRWVKVTPAFDRETCRKADYPTVEFDGKNGAIFPEKDKKGRKFITYLKIHGEYSDLPLEELLESWRKVYGEDKVKLWKKAYEVFYGE